MYSNVTFVLIMFPPDCIIVTVRGPLSEYGIPVKAPIESSFLVKNKQISYQICMCAYVVPYVCDLKFSMNKESPIHTKTIYWTTISFHIHYLAVMIIQNCCCLINLNGFGC